jgi:hypothetical protein
MKSQVKYYALLKPRWFIVIVIFLSSSLSCDAQYFSNRYTLNRLYGFLSSLVVVDDTVYAMFTSRDSVINKPIGAFAKFDKTGGLLSIQYFDIPSKVIGTNINTLIRTRDGGFAYGGFTQDTLGTENTLLIIKYDRFGDFQWYNEIIDTNYLYILPQVFTQDSFSNYYFSGDLTQKIRGDHDIYIAKTDSLGHSIYLKVFVDPTLDDATLGICINHKGHIVLGGSGVSNTILGKGNMKIYELDTGGNVLKYIVYPDSNGPGAANIIALEDGGYMIASEYACYKSQNVVGGVGCIEKFDSNFNITWRTDMGVCSIYNDFFSLRKTPDGNYIATGVAYNDTVLYTNPMNGNIVKIKETGQLIWNREYRGLSNYTNSDNNELTSFDFLSNGDIIVGGEALDWSDTIHPQQGWLMRLDSSGCLPDSSRCGLLPDGIAQIIPSQIVIKVYPNPATNFVNINYQIADADDAAKLVVTNIMGQNLYATALSGTQGTHAISTRSWPTGLYFYQMVSDRGYTTSGSFLVNRE